MKLTEGMVLADRYEIIEPIGAGGMALVYKAKDLKLERIVTVKVLREEYIKDEEFLKRFNVEARSAASLSNPNIVNVYDVGKEDDINFIIMEFIDGVTLKELIVRRAPFDNEEALGVAIQIASALSHAHKGGIIHRDIKPQNIMVTRNGIVKVTDFGIARSADSQTTTTSSNAMGSVHYFSPEQARGRFVDHRSDIYALGIVMFEMATGVLPYDGDSAVSVALKHINEELPDMKAINPGISVSVMRIINKAAAKSSSQRYASADEMLVDLKKAITNESGDFVTHVGHHVSSGTRIMNDEDMSTINDGSLYDDFDDEDYDEEYEDDFDEDEIDDEDRRSERKIIIAAICTAVAIIALITSIGIWLYKGNGSNGSGEANTMISLAGMSVEDAKAVLKPMGVEIGQIEETYDDKYEQGLIVSQNPEQGTAIANGSTIAVTISKGTDKIEVPDVTNKVISDVYTMREFANNIFVLDDVYEYSDDFPSHVVIRQEPAVGSLAERGSTITAFVSRGKEMKMVFVPNILGDSEESAKRKLEDAGLKVGKVSTGHSEAYPEGQVAMQSYEGGKEVPEDTVVTFVVSTGPRAQGSTASEAPENTARPTEIPATGGETPQSNNLLRAKDIEIPAPMDALNQGPVRIHVNKISEGNTERILEKSGLLLADFPLTLTVSGNQPFEIQIYVNGHLESRENFDLSQ